MRFISQITEFGGQVRPIIITQLLSGGERVEQEPIYIKFTPGDVSSHEIEEAKKRFSFHGYMTEMDEVTMVNPLTRLSSFDTEAEAIRQNWTQDEKVLVEEWLLEREGADLFRCLPAPVAAPWPLYDEFSKENDVETLFAKLEEDGHEYIDVLRYERSEDGQKRPELIALLDQKVEEVESAKADREFITAA